MNAGDAAPVPTVGARRAPPSIGALLARPGWRLVPPALVAAPALAILAHFGLLSPGVKVVIRNDATRDPEKVEVLTATEAYYIGTLRRGESVCLRVRTSDESSFAFSWHGAGGEERRGAVDAYWEWGYVGAHHASIGDDGVRDRGGWTMYPWPGGEW